MITKVNGKNVTLDQTLSYIVANLPVGTNVPIELTRNGKKMSVTAQLKQRPPEEELVNNSFDPDAQQEDGAEQNDDGVSAKATYETLGMSVVNLTPAIARQIGVSSTEKGVVVSNVDPASDAAQKGITRGFLITSVDRQAVTTADQLDKIISSVKKSGKSAVLLRLQRGARDPAFVAVRLNR